MMRKLFILLSVLTGLSFTPPVTNYYICDKGIYVKSTNSKKIKVKYKEELDFFFTLKNDSTALIQDIEKNKLKKIREYKISAQIDTVYVKNFIVLKGKRILKVDKVIFRKVYR